MSGPPGGSDLPSGLRSLSVTIDTSEIASPHDFGFQLRQYVVAPEVREGEKPLDVFHHPFAYAASRPKLASGGSG